MCGETLPACGKQQGPSETCENEKCKADLKKVKSALTGLRFHDLRHHAITELAKSQASDSTVMAIAGHVSPKMLAHYSHVRIQAKGTALNALSTKPTERDSSGGSPQGVKQGVTTQRTTQNGVPPKPAQVIENLVELVGIEPTTSSLRTMTPSVIM